MSELGDALRGARLKKNLTLAEVAQATRIKEPFLGALEDGDYHLLPGPAYVTGFLRNYARFLGINPDDALQEYYDAVPPRQPAVKAASRVLASGYERYNRTRLLWGLGVLVLLLVGGYAIKQYNDTYAHAYSPPLLTPANLGSASVPAVQQHHAAPTTFTVKVRAIAPVWLRVTVDGHQSFQGILRPVMIHEQWTATNAVYVLTYDGARVRATYNGRYLGRLAQHTGLLVDLATASGWHRVS